MQALPRAFGIAGRGAGHDFPVSHAEKRSAVHVAAESLVGGMRVHADGNRPVGGARGVTGIAILAFEFGDALVDRGNEFFPLLGRGDAKGDRRELAEVGRISDLRAIGRDPIAVARSARSILPPEHAVECFFQFRRSFLMRDRFWNIARRALHASQVQQCPVEKCVMI